MRVPEEVTEPTHPTEICPIGPTLLHQTTSPFAERVEGEVVWFNACPRMFENKEPCDVILRPFVDNPSITVIRLVLDHAQREH